jgi:hypothetical protein
LVAGHNPGSLRDRKTALGQQQTAQRPQIVEDPPAGCNVEIEFGEIVRDQEQRLFATIRPIVLGSRDLTFNVAAGFIDGIREQSYILVRALNIVKRRFGFYAHKHALSTASLRVACLY